MLTFVGMTAEELEIALWFHDSVEDTKRMTVPMLLALYGKVVSGAVHAVTDVEGESRTARKWGTPECPGPMVKMRSCPPGLLVKLIDRIANVEACIAAEEKLPPQKRGKSMLGKYRKEQVDLRTLRKDGWPLGPLWDHLEELLGVVGPEAFAYTQDSLDR